jgi:hypothetical protein
MRKYIFISILIFLFFGSLVWYTSKRKSENIDTANPSIFDGNFQETNNSPVEYSIFNNFNDKSVQPKDSRFFYNQDDPDVLTAKNVILKDSTMSEKYLDEHFKFVSRIKDRYVHRVDFLFSIGDYSIITSVNLPNENGNFSYSALKDFHEISKVMSKEEAGRALIKCLDNNPFKNQQATLGIYKGGLFLNVTDLKWNASLNLETGECEKTKFIPFRD